MISLVVAQIRPLATEDRAQVVDFLTPLWQTTTMIVHGTTYQLETLPGFVALENGRWVGLATYHIVDNACELVSLDSLRHGSGCGTALLEAVRKHALEHGCTRLWLITTNDNLDALRFYQRRHLVLKALYPGAVEASRQLKSSIPLFGNHGIPIRDELELEQHLP